MTKREAIQQRKLDGLEAEFRLLLPRVLKECAAGRWGLFGQNDAADGTKYLFWALSQKKFSQSEPLAREVMEIERKNQPDDWQRFRAESLVGASLAGQKRYTDAEPLLIEGYRGMVARKGRIEVPNWDYVDRASDWIADLYAVSGKPEKAAKWKRKRN
jgi:hypothetical protein